MTTLLLLLILGSLVAPSIAAAEKDSDAIKPPTQSITYPNEVNPQYMIHCASGYLFINRIYLHPPYQITRYSDHLTINGERINLGAINLRDFVDDPEPNAQTNQATMLVSITPHRDGLINDKSPLSNADQHQRVADKLAEAIQATLRMGGITILANKQAPLFLDHSYGVYEFLEAITKSPQVAARSTTSIEPPKALTQMSEKLAWHSFFEMQPHDENLKQRAIVDLSEINNADTLGNQICTANLIAAFLGYPLTLSAMVLVVVAFGHLINNKPQLDPSLSPVEIKRIIVKSLIIIAMLSMIDLTWTLMAHTSGMMREMNPVGVSLIKNPIQLILFKIGVVSLSIGLLYGQHQRPKAQAATWWSCLTLTLLTARWLTFQSMFL